MTVTGESRQPRWWRRRPTASMTRLFSAPGPTPWRPRRGPGARGGPAHLDALLVALEEVGARVPGAVALEELLGEPAIEALVVLALHVGAALPDAVHGGGGAL